MYLQHACKSGVKSYRMSDPSSPTAASSSDGRKQLSAVGSNLFSSLKTFTQRLSLDSLASEVDNNDEFGGGHKKTSYENMEEMTTFQDFNHQRRQQRQRQRERHQSLGPCFRDASQLSPPPPPRHHSLAHDVPSRLQSTSTKDIRACDIYKHNGDQIDTSRNRRPISLSEHLGRHSNRRNTRARSSSLDGGFDDDHTAASAISVSTTRTARSSIRRSRRRGTAGGDGGVGAWRRNDASIRHQRRYSMDDDWISGD